MGTEDILKGYRTRIESNNLLLVNLKKKQLIISMLRLLSFIGGVILTIAAWSASALAGVAVLLVSAALFLLFVKQYVILADRISFTGNLARINTDEASAMEGDRQAFADGARWMNRDHDFSNDIDLFGEGSLFEYLNRTVTGRGREILAIWLSDPYSLSDRIPERQEAVKELSGKIGWRQEFLAYGLGHPLENDDIESVKTWLDEGKALDLPEFLKKITLVFQILPSAVLILAIAGVVPFEFSGPFFIINLGLTLAFLTRTKRIHDLVSRKHLFLSSFERLIFSFEKERFSSVIVTAIRGRLCRGDLSAREGIKRLSRIIRAFDSRLNVFAGFVLNSLLLWDFQCILRLDAWKKKYRDELKGWLDAIGEIDAFLSLANHSYNNPDFIFPAVAADDTILIARDIGHPLIDRKVRVCNDFAIERKGLICIITGANMAGKSTFLRTAAVNLILAMAGTSVCAGEMIFRPVKLFSSMRTTDSLNSRESYFYAELKRLKILKEKLENGEDMFFILDEILKGTNSEDKSTGSKLFLEKIVERKGTGIIATHDISLGELEAKFPGIVFNKCFEIEINGESVTFDYRLRDGITRHMNAGLLMKQMGII